MKYDTTVQANATKVSIFINVIGVIIAIWFAFSAEHYFWSAIFTMLFPLVYFVVVVVYKGLIPFNTSCLAFIICSIVLLIKGFKIAMVEYGNVWLYVLILSVVILLLLIQSSEFLIKTKQGRTNILLSILFLILYSYGVITLSNCVFDQSKPQILETTISDMKITFGTKSQTYHFYLAPWGSKENIDHITVTEAQYNSAHVGDTVHVHVSQGFLRAAWYSVTMP
jgi:hypothetical protein